jgi:hypothetical protein
MQMKFYGRADEQKLLEEIYALIQDDFSEV